jgi:hypothetical protein
MSAEASIPHSRSAVQRLAEIADGKGGNAVLVTGVGPPYYAGLRRRGSRTLIEAILTLLNPSRYQEILLATGEGEHLPDIQVSQRSYCGRHRMIWLFKRANQAGTADDNSKPDPFRGLLETEKLQEFVKKGDRLEVASHLHPWPEQMSDLIDHITKRLAPGKPRTLIVIDDELLQPRPQHDQANQADRPSSGKSNDIARAFKDLPSRCRESSADIILLCRSAGIRDAVAAEKAEGPITYELLRNAGDSQLARLEAERDARLFPKLLWPGADAIELQSMDPKEWNGAWLPSADPHQSFYHILRTTTPVPKEDPLAALEPFIAMDQVRDKLRELQDLLRFEQERLRRGQQTEPLSLHVVLYGQPGTGKTEVAKAIAHIYRQLGLLSGSFVACAGRADLIGRYVGETAIKTRAKCEEARGGVLFIDEAYLLAQGGEGDFGKEAIGELLDYMTSYKDQLAVIAAGYPEPMRQFLRANEGLRRRFGQHINMPDYTDDQLVDILVLQARRSGKTVADAARPVIRAKIAGHRQACAAARLSFGFAGDAVTLLEKARLAQARRLRARVLATMSNDELGLLTIEDFHAAQLDLPT